MLKSKQPEIFSDLESEGEGEREREIERKRASEREREREEREREREGGKRLNIVRVPFFPSRLLILLVDKSFKLAATTKAKKH